jgi:hypothetical protein
MYRLTMSAISLSQGTENTGEVHLVDIVFRSGAMPPHVRGLLCLCMLRCLMHTSCRQFSLCASVLAIFLFFVLIRTNSPELFLHTGCSLAQVATTIFVRLATEDKAAMAVAAAAVAAAAVAAAVAALDPPAIEARPRPHPRHPRPCPRHRPRFPPRSSPVRIKHCSAEWRRVPLPRRARQPLPPLRPRGVLPMVPPYRFRSMRRIRLRRRPRLHHHHTRRVVVVELPLGCNAITASNLATIRPRARTLRAHRAPRPRPPRRHFNLSMVPAAATIIVAVGARDRGPALTVDKKVRLHFCTCPPTTINFIVFSICSICKRSGRDMYT